MRYGLTKKLTSGDFGLLNIIVSFLTGIIIEGVFGAGGKTEPYGLGGFCFFGLLRVVFYAIGTVLVYKLFKKSCLWDNETDFDEVERKTKNNKKLGDKVRMIDDLNSFDPDFTEQYPPARKQLKSGLKTAKLKDYEKDYVNWIFEFYDEIYKKKKKKRIIIKEIKITGNALNVITR